MADDSLIKQLEHRIASLETRLRAVSAGGVSAGITRVAAFSEGSCTNNCTAACTIGCTSGCTGGCYQEPQGIAEVAAAKGAQLDRGADQVEAYNRLLR